MEDFHADSIASLAALRMIDLEMPIWHSEMHKVGLGDPLVAHIVGDLSPGFVNCWAFPYIRIVRRREIVFEFGILHGACSWRPCTVLLHILQRGREVDVREDEQDR